jgi:hypothetical protein
MANVILTSGGLVPAPEPDQPPLGGPPMAEEYTYPRFYFSKDEPNGRPFNSKEELDAAGGPSVWKLTPTEVTAQAPPTPTPAPEEGEGEPHTRRSHR